MIDIQSGIGGFDMKLEKYKALKSNGSENLLDELRDEVFDESERYCSQKTEKTENIEFMGTTLGVVKNTNLTYGMDKFNTPRGHGFAAERANHLYDVLNGKEASIVGDNNAKNGADRIVNGQKIQTKFCNSGAKCVAECFDTTTHKMKYCLENGQPMQIEVPKDKYLDALKAMEERIKKGQVPGVSDPKKAKEIIKESPFTYEQVKNIAKFGTIESLTFDAINGVIISAEIMGISALVSFAIATWNGKGFEEALEEAVQVSLKTGGLTFVASVISSQMAKTGVNATLKNSTDFLVQKIGPKAASQIANAFRSGGNIYGVAAMNNVSKILRGNFLTGAVTVVVLSSVDVINIFRGRISGAQLFKNVANTASGVAGGMSGFMAGAAFGSVIPVVGTFVGGLLGAFVGGSAAAKVSSTVLNELIEDDIQEMIRIIEEEFSKLAIDYLLNQAEAEKISDLLKSEIDADKLKDMYASYDREKFAREILIPSIEEVVSERKQIRIPEDDKMLHSLQVILEKSMEESA